MMVINRRRFLAALLAGGGIVIAGWPKAATVGGTVGLLLSACDDIQGQHWLSGWQRDGRPVFRIAVSHRAHAVATRPGHHQAVFFARRPGTELYVVDLRRGQLSHQVSSPDGYHFFGHGVFSRDGRYLFTTENAYHEGQGVIAVYDTENYQRIDQFHSGNIGPHQLEFLSDGKTLVVANGGILTHPQRPRETLNLDSMQSSLTYLDSHSHQILADYRPQHPRMSIRHLAVAANDQVVMGVQFQGAASELLPLVLHHRGEAQLQPMQANELHWLGQKQYIASVAIDKRGQRAMTTSPRGNNISLWDLPSGELLHSESLRDVAGAAYSEAERGFLLSNGLGQVMKLGLEHGAGLQAVFSQRTLRWDNHLAMLG